MPEPILLLRLEGPMQSWGVRSRWSRRDTDPEPTKSAIIGLLGCAAGILRPDWHSKPKADPDRTLEQWDKALRFGVRVDRPGTIETDYHTAEGHFRRANDKMNTASHRSGAKSDGADIDPLHTEITWRDYLHDAAFLVALVSDDPKLLGQLAGQSEHPDWPGDLQFPKWPLYLGRKSCVPSRPIFDRLANEYEDIENALRSERWAAPLSPKERKSLKRDKQPPNLLAWIECPDGDYERQDAMRLNQLRFYDFRRCRRIDIDTRSVPWRTA